MATVSLGNEELTEGYTATQVGFYAMDPDEGEILYFLAQAEAGEGTPVPSATEMPGYSAEWNFYFQYGMADGVTVTVDPTGTVSREEMRTYIDTEIVALTIDEIEHAVGFLGDGTVGEGGGEGGGGATVTTLDHSLLYNRNIADQHSIESITGLEEALTVAAGAELTTLNVENAWADAMQESQEE